MNYKMLLSPDISVTFKTVMYGFKYFPVILPNLLTAIIK